MTPMPNVSRLGYRPDGSVDPLFADEECVLEGVRSDSLSAKIGSYLARVEGTGSSEGGKKMKRLERT